LRPEPIGDQCVFQPGGLGAAGRDRAQVGTDALFQGIAYALRLGGIAPRAFFDYPLDGRDRECDAGGLDALQVERRQQARLALPFPSGRQAEIGEFAEVAAGGGTRPAVQQGRNRGRGAGDVPDAAVLDQNRRRALAEVETASAGSG